MVHAAVVRPAVELCHVLELLPAEAVDGQECAAQVGERAEVAPELLELGDRIDILLAVPPTPLHVLDSDIGRHASRQRADGGGDLLRVAFEVVANQPQVLEQSVDLDPGRADVL